MTLLEHDWFPRPLPPHIELGDRSWLHSSYAFHHSYGTVRIGADCGIYAGTQFELGPDADVEIGDFCTIVGAIIATNGRVSIGDHTFIAHEVVIADSPFALPPIGEDSGPLRGVRRMRRGRPERRGMDAERAVAATTIRPRRDGVDGPTDAERSEAPLSRRTSCAIEIGAGAWIGARAILLATARIGRDAVVGAGAVVTGEVPSGATAVGDPMRIVSC